MILKVRHPAVTGVYCTVRDSRSGCSNDFKCTEVDCKLMHCLGSIITFNSSLTAVCSSDRFPCSNGDCLPLYVRCNGIDECGDGSDERMCGGEYIMQL